MPRKGWKHTNPSKPESLRGKVFGRLFVLEMVDGRKPPHWLCQCDCGTWSIVSSSNLKAGRQVSCGCLNDELRKERTEKRKKSKEHKLEVHRKHSLNYSRKNRHKTKERYYANREQRIKSCIEWARKNPDKRRAAIRNYRAKKKKRVQGKHTADDIQRLFSLQQGKCAGCKCNLPKSYHVDHVVPQSKGGSNDPLNLQLLCPPCNIRKHVKSQTEFMQMLGYLL